MRFQKNSLCALALIGLMMICAACQTTLPSADLTETSGPNAMETNCHGLLLRSAISTTDDASGSVFLKVELENRSNSPVTSFRIPGRNIDGCFLTVFDNNHAPCRFTQIGKTELGYHDESERGEWNRRISGRVYKRDETHIWDIDLSKYFELEAGQYEVNVMVHAIIPILDEGGNQQVEPSGKKAFWHSGDVTVGPLVFKVQPNHPGIR